MKKIMFILLFSFIFTANIFSAGYFVCYQGVAFAVATNDQTGEIEAVAPAGACYGGPWVVQIFLINPNLSPYPPNTTLTAQIANNLNTNNTIQLTSKQKTDFMNLIANCSVNEYIDETALTQQQIDFFK